MANRRRSTGILISITVIFLATTLLAGIFTMLRQDFFRTAQFIKLNEHCTASVGGHSSSVNLEQGENLAIITAAALGKNLPPRASTIGIVTAWQESSLRNLNYGDLDSLGLFQQRPSQGWGTPEQIMNPWYSSRRFYDALVKVPHWENGDINDIAQTVQRSAHPTAYRKHESNGRTWASVLTGHSPRAVSCLSRGNHPGKPEAVTTTLTSAYPNAITITAEGNEVVVYAQNETTAWSSAHLAMLVKHSGLISVHIGEWMWTNDENVLAQWKQGAVSDPKVVRLAFKR